MGNTDTFIMIWISRIQIGCCAPCYKPNDESTDVLLNIRPMDRISNPYALQVVVDSFSDDAP